MAGTSVANNFVRTFKWGSAGAQSVLVIPQKDWADSLHKTLPKELKVDGFWGSPLPSKTIFQSVAGGPCLTMFAHDQPDVGATEQSRALLDLHMECFEQNKVAVMALDGSCDLFLVPIRVVEGANRGPLPSFWGWVLGRGAVQLAASQLESSRLPLVFDLDETLLVAFTLHSLYGRAQMLREAMSSERDVVSEEAARLQQQSMSEELQLLEADLEMLKQFSETDSVTVNGKTLHARAETVIPEAAGEPRFTRPVVRAEEQGMVFTRIDPERRDTSMIMRKRPGWDTLRAYLLGQEAGSNDKKLPMKLRWDVYVCTAAERGYALEAWRLLDPDGALIPPERRPQRITCVSRDRKKTLAKVLGIGPLIRRRSGPDGSDEFNRLSSMPMAVIVDDRLEVWEECVQEQVLKVLPYVPHRSPVRDGHVVSDAEMGSVLSEEMVRVRDVLHAVRVNIYFAMNHEVTPKVKELDAAQNLARGAFLPDAPPLLPSVPRVPALLKDDKLEPKRVLPKGPPPAQANAASLRPVDPRQLRQQAAQNNSQAPGAVPPGLAGTSSAPGSGPWGWAGGSGGGSGSAAGTSSGVGSGNLAATWSGSLPSTASSAAAESRRPVDPRRAAMQASASTAPRSEQPPARPAKQLPPGLGPEPSSLAPVDPRRQRQQAAAAGPTTQAVPQLSGPGPPQQRQTAAQDPRLKPPAVTAAAPLLPHPPTAGPPSGPQAPPLASGNGLGPPPTQGQPTAVNGGGFGGAVGAAQGGGGPHMQPQKPGWPPPQQHLPPGLAAAGGIPAGPQQPSPPLQQQQQQPPHPGQLSTSQGVSAQGEHSMMNEMTRQLLVSHLQANPGAVHLLGQQPPNVLSQVMNILRTGMPDPATAGPGGFPGLGPLPPPPLATAAPPPGLLPGQPQQLPAPIVLRPPGQPLPKPVTLPPPTSQPAATRPPPPAWAQGAAAQFATLAQPPAAGPPARQPPPFGAAAPAGPFAPPAGPAPSEHGGGDGSAQDGAGASASSAPTPEHPAELLGIYATRKHVRLRFEEELLGKNTNMTQWRIKVHLNGKVVAAAEASHKKDAKRIASAEVLRQMGLANVDIRALQGHALPPPPNPPPHLRGAAAASAGPGAAPGAGLTAPAAARITEATALEAAQDLFPGQLQYTEKRDRGPPASFTCTARLEGRPGAEQTGVGNSKKRAKAYALLRLLHSLGIPVARGPAGLLDDVVMVPPVVPAAAAAAGPGPGPARPAPHVLAELASLAQHYTNNKRRRGEEMQARVQAGDHGPLAQRSKRSRGPSDPDSSAAAARQAAAAAASSQPAGPSGTGAAAAPQPSRSAGAPESSSAMEASSGQERATSDDSLSMASRGSAGVQSRRRARERPEVEMEGNGGDSRGGESAADDEVLIISDSEDGNETEEGEIQ